MVGVEPPPPHGVPTSTVDAKASGRARVYQVGQGTQNINNFYGGSGRPPATSAELHLWVAQAVRDFRDLSTERGVHLRRRESADLLGTLDRTAEILAYPSHVNKHATRHLIVSGLVHHLSEYGPPPVQPIPEQVILDIAVAALWPLVTAPLLPESWSTDLMIVTSPRVTALVSEARRLMAEGRTIVHGDFSRALSSQSFAQGMANLLDDLCDPKGSGPILTALAMAGRITPPPTKANVKLMAGWLFAVVAGGEAVRYDAAIEERIDSIVAGLVDILHGGRRTGGSSLLDELLEQMFTGHH